MERTAPIHLIGVRKLADAWHAEGGVCPMQLTETVCGSWLKRSEKNLRYAKYILQLEGWMDGRIDIRQIDFFIPI